MLRDEMPCPEWISESVRAAVALVKPGDQERLAVALSREIFRRFPLDTVIRSTGVAMHLSGVSLTDELGAAVGKALANAIFDGPRRAV